MRAEWQPSLEWWGALGIIIYVGFTADICINKKKAILILSAFNYKHWWHKTADFFKTADNLYFSCVIKVKLLPPPSSSSSSRPTSYLSCYSHKNASWVQERTKSTENFLCLIQTRIPQETHTRATVHLIFKRTRNGLRRSCAKGNANNVCDVRDVCEVRWAEDLCGCRRRYKVHFEQHA